MADTVADVVVATLKASGVRRVYGIPGDSLNGFTDALRRDGGGILREGAAGGVRGGGRLAVAAAGGVAGAVGASLAVDVVVRYLGHGSWPFWRRLRSSRSGGCQTSGAAP